MLGNHSSRNGRIVSVVISVVAVLLYGSSAHADNKAMAKLAFEEARASYDAKEYGAALAQLEDSKGYFGGVNGPIEALEIMARHALLTTELYKHLAASEYIDEVIKIHNASGKFLEDHGDDKRLESEARKIYEIYNDSSVTVKVETKTEKRAPDPRHVRYFPEVALQSDSSRSGVLLLNVPENGKVSGMGFLSGDMIVSVDGIEVKDTDHLFGLLEDDPVRVGGQRLIHVLRDGSSVFMKID